MAWQIEFLESANRALIKLDKKIQFRILNFLRERIKENPRCIGKPLVGRYAVCWRYRVGDYRIITKHENNQLIILVIEIWHRREIYKMM